MLLGLIALGIVLRLLAIVSWWPVSPTLEDGYQRFAAQSFLDPQHPAGYDLIVAALGAITREIAFPVLVQHLLGLSSALLFFAATRRATGSAWAGLVPLFIVLLDPDLIFLEHAIMSETWAIFTLAVGFYAAVRCGEDPRRWRWPLVAGIALAAAVVIRTASLPSVAVITVALVVWPRAASVSWRTSLRAAGVFLATVAVLLLGFAGVRASSGQPFGIAPSPGWYLYGRVAQFADCHQFTPPPGTESLCQSTPASQRPSAYFYTFESGSPAVRRFGSFGRDDALVGGWARRALEAQPSSFLSLAWVYLRSYWFPSSLPARIKASSTELDPQLDFTNAGNPFYVAAGLQDLQSYYDRFHVHPWHGGLQFLHDWQRVIRFGATLFLITTLLTLLGLAIGSRRSRAGVLLFGVGGLSLLVAPVLTGTYSGRYTVPLAAPMMAAAAIAVTELVRTVRRRRRPGSSRVAAVSPK